MERIESEAPQCGLCSKVSAQAVRIAKCSHVYCTLCLFDYLAKRRYCPICVPKKAKSRSLGKYILTYLHPLKLIKKIKKHNKKIARKHLIPVTATNRNLSNNQAGERDFRMFGFFVGSNSWGLISGSLTSELFIYELLISGPLISKLLTFELLDNLTLTSCKVSERGCKCC